MLLSFYLLSLYLCRFLLTFLLIPLFLVYISNRSYFSASLTQESYYQSNPSGGGYLLRIGRFAIRVVTPALTSTTCTRHNRALATMHCIQDTLKEKAWTQSSTRPPKEERQKLVCTVACCTRSSMTSDTQLLRTLA